MFQHERHRGDEARGIRSKHTASLPSPGIQRSSATKQNQTCPSCLSWPVEHGGDVVDGASWMWLSKQHTQVLYAVGVGAAAAGAAAAFSVLTAVAAGSAAGAAAWVVGPASSLAGSLGTGEALISCRTICLKSFTNWRMGSFCLPEAAALTGAASTLISGAGPTGSIAGVGAANI